MKPRQRLAHARSGNVAVMFGLAFMPTMLLVGSGVDYARAVEEKEQLQIAVDAAVITGIDGVRRNLSDVSVQAMMLQVAKANDRNPAVALAPMVKSVNNTTLCVTAQSQVTTAIMSIASVKTIPVAAMACSKMNIDTYEIAVAVDNSGSMSHSANNGQTKIAAAQQAANGLVSAMTGSGNVSVAFSVVPFAAAVNIGAAYKNASFMDTTGASSIHWENINRTNSSVSPLPTSRFDLYSAMSVAWGGCVEERPGSLASNDVAPTTSNPNSLFVPMFAPDEIDGNSNDLNQYLQESKGSGSCSQQDINNQPNGQTRLCKYYGQRPVIGTNVFALQTGPNLGCTTKPLLPLDATPSDVTSSINAMTPSGDTTELEGVMWAWRTISPNGPFATGNPNTSTTSGQQTPRAYNYVNPTTGAHNHKIIILLTDGEDHWVGQYPDANGTYPAGSASPNQSLYSSLGYFANNRLGSTDANNARQLVDTATTTACSNAQAAGVEIYTVGFTASDGISSQGLSLLTSCATDASHSFVAADGTQLIQTFQTIAATLTKPRLSN